MRFSRLHVMSAAIAEYIVSVAVVERAWDVDPLRCPVCQSPMRVIASLMTHALVEKACATSVLGTTARPAPAERHTALRLRPYGNGDPMPDYENALTDSGALSARPAGGLCWRGLFARGRAERLRAGEQREPGKICMARLARSCPSPSLAGRDRNERERKAILLHPRSVQCKRARQN